MLEILEVLLLPSLTFSKDTQEAIMIVRQLLGMGAFCAITIAWKFEL